MVQWNSGNKNKKDLNNRKIKNHSPSSANQSLKWITTNNKWITINNSNELQPITQMNYNQSLKWITTNNSNELQPITN